MNVALTDKQFYDAAFMSGLDFCLFLSPYQSSFLQNISVCCQAFFSLAMGPVDTRIRHFSHGGEWDKLAAITIHEAV